MTKVTLSKPIKVGDAMVSELTFREAEIGDMIAADSVKGETAKTAAVLAAMCGISYPEFKKLAMRDLNVILRDVGALLGNDQTPAESGEE